MSITKISKRYARIINMGNYETIRIELELEKTTENATPQQIREISEKLLVLEKSIVEQEAKKIQAERKEV